MNISQDDLTTPLTPGSAATILDHAEIVERFGDDPQLVLELYGIFSQECPNYYAAISSALTQADARAVFRAAHTLKGSVANFGITPAMELAQQLETIGREGNLAHASEVGEKLAQALQDLVAQMRIHLNAGERPLSS